MNKITKFTITLFVVCFIAAFALAYVYIYTQPRIKYWKAYYTELAVKAVLPNATEIKTKIHEETTYYVGIKDNRSKGRAIASGPKGYGGPIKILVGVDPEGKVTGVEILEQLETPGLGANIVTQNFKGTGKSFVSQFIGKTLGDKIKAKQDIDALTGATISTNAVCDGVKKALMLNQEIKE